VKPRRTTAAREARPGTGLAAAVRSRDTGAAAAELALVMPLLLLLLFGIIDFGRMLNAQITLTQAAREGARAQALGLAAAPRVLAASTNLNGVAVEPGPTCAAGADATVTASYTFEFVTPVGALAAMFGDALQDSAQLTGKGVMPCKS
jgi:Flp pilus assembly protein TadG